MQKILYMKKLNEILKFLYVKYSKASLSERDENKLGLNILQTYISSFVTYELPAAIFEVTDINNILDYLVKVDFS